MRPTPGNGVRPIVSMSAQRSTSGALELQLETARLRIGGPSRASDATPTRGLGGIAAATLPDYRSLTANPPRCAQLAARPLRLQQRRSQPRHCPSHAQIPDRDGETYGVQWKGNYR